MKRVTSILSLLLLCFPVYSQDAILTGSQTEQKSDEIKIYFDQGSHAINLDLQQNRESLQHFSDLFEKLNSDSMSVISRIEIDCYASPEGGHTYNKQLSERRADAIYDYLSDTISVPDSLIKKNYSGVDWAALQELVEESDMQYRDDVLYILKNVPEETWQRVNPDDRWLTLVDSRNKHLMDLKYGRPYHWMLADIYPELRGGLVVSIYHIIKQPEVVKEEVATEVVEPEKEPIVMEQVAEEPQPQQIEESQCKFAIKSNLLQLGAGVANIGVEVGFGDKFSVDLPFAYSPYTIKSDWRIRTLTIQPELRYWLKESFTGHFFGVHTHVGYFNVSTDNQYRYQNSAETPLWGCGISYGYALNLYKRLNLEFNVGAGYANIQYDTYYNFDSVGNGALCEANQQRGYWGITRAGISLVYMFNLKK